MTDENAKKKYDHLKNIINGNVKTGNPVRDELILSDAHRHLKQLIEKRPNLVFEEVKEEVKEIKSKGKN